MRRCLPAIVLVLAVAGPAAALDLPARKPGLWEVKMTFEGSQLPTQVAQHCIDAKTDKLMQEKFNGGQDVCSKQDMSRSGNTITVDSSCKIGDKETTTHAVFEGDFDSAYTVKVSTALDGIKRNMNMQAKWLGPCKPDQKPGDIEMQGGMKMNILEMPKVPGTPQK